jgi:hypothetical protein
MADQAFIEKVRELKAAGKTKEEALAELGELSPRQKISAGMVYVNRRKGATVAKAAAKKAVKTTAKASPVSADEKDLVIEELKAEVLFLRTALAISKKRLDRG